MENINPKKKSPDFFHNPLFWIIIAAFILLLVFPKLVQNIRLPKKTLVNEYGIDKKSFNKWVEYFCADIIPDMDVYKRKRTVSLCEYFMITHQFGKPDNNPILTKREIVNLAEGTYRSLRECIKNNPAAFGLPSFEAFQHLQKFPPNIGKRMLEQYS